MGPRSGERGEEKLRADFERDYAASMGPRSGERGEFKPQFAPLVESGASMGPRSGERGEELHRAPSPLESLGLQWGRARVSAERRETTD